MAVVPSLSCWAVLHQNLLLKLQCKTQTDVLFLRSSSFDNLPDVVDADWLTRLTAGEALLHGPEDVAALFWGSSRLVDTLFGGKDGIQSVNFNLFCFQLNFN